MIECPALYKSQQFFSDLMNAFYDAFALLGTRPLFRLQTIIK